MPQMMRSQMLRASRSAAIPLWVVAGCLLLTGCGGGQKASTDGYQVKDAQTAAPAGGYKVGKPYQINGVWYYPSEDYSYDETGIASWYGPDFHGKYTANGDVFDQNGVTAAHRTLPMPSIVRVTNLENGRSIEVKVNDRGPFAHGRILDLSKHAAELLGMDMQGTARVRVQIMADESRALALQLQGQGAALIGHDLDPDAGGSLHVHAQQFGGVLGQIENAAMGERPAVIDADDDRTAILEIGDAHDRRHRQGPVRRGHGVLVEHVAIGGVFAVEIRPVP